MENCRGTKRLVSILAVLVLFMAQPICLFAGDDAIHRIDPPAVFYDRDGGYRFIAFGDTRTANPDSWEAEKGTAFKTIRDWTHREVNIQLYTEASFAMFTGDMLWRGSSRKYWREALDLIPPGFRARDSYRFFPVLGNHELWQAQGEADAMDLYYHAFPFLSEKQVRFHNYYFIIGDSLFISLCSGGYGTDPEGFKKADRTWNCTVISSFESLMSSLRDIYKQMVNAGQRPRNIFVQYHKPSYSTFKHPPLDTANDPLTTLMALKRNAPALSVFVLNGHNHVTELFQPADRVYTLTAGGGGAPQKTGMPSRNWGKPMRERFWEAVGHARNRRFNFFRIHVDAGGMAAVEEMCLYSYDEGAHIGYGPGVMIDRNGDIFFGGNGRGNADGTAIIELVEKGYSR